MGDEPIIIEQFFYGFEGVIMGLIMEVKILWVRIMGVTLVIKEKKKKKEKSLWIPEIK